jgi:chromosome segregation ATPase
MADNTGLLNQIRQVVQEENETIKADVSSIKNDLQGVKTAQQEQGEDIKAIKTVQHVQGEKLDTLLSSQAHIETVLETLDEKIEATKEEVDEIKKRQRPRHAD